ncbi:hypothetical protein ACFE33_12870 [Falsihalocynthiibacter sp. SS001]|uniref:hypothetical protein n=1 Tax=Falsihalocynthiibacter sp. SS001 TaxID=3349698 RepID=UPI0036D2197F
MRQSFGVAHANGPLARRKKAGVPMSKLTSKKKASNLPKIVGMKDGVLQIELKYSEQLQEVLGVQTSETSRGLLTAALNSLGVSREGYQELLLAVSHEMKPNDPLESMLITQLTTTHVAMCKISSKMFDAQHPQLEETYERSVTRLSRTYMAQLAALKKYRAKAQQTVRVERVTVEEGGQAIVGDVNHMGV